MIKPTELRKARSVAGMTQKEAADFIYMGESTYSKYEGGQFKGKQETDNYRARTELLLLKCLHRGKVYVEQDVKYFEALLEKY